VTGPIAGFKFPDYEYRYRRWDSDDPWSEWRPIVGQFVVTSGTVTINGLTYDSTWQVDVRSSREAMPLS
jgi:hypothetical protein